MYFYRIEILFGHVRSIFLYLPRSFRFWKPHKLSKWSFLFLFLFFFLSGGCFVFRTNRSRDAKDESIVILVDKISRIFQTIVSHLFCLLRILYLNSIARRKMPKIGGYRDENEKTAVCLSGEVESQPEAGLIDERKVNASGAGQDRGNITGALSSNFQNDFRI